MEKGPFGKSNRRSTSRSKTATPSAKEDLAKLENTKTIDEIFGSFKASMEETRASRDTKSAAVQGPLPHARSAMDLATSTNTGAMASQSQASKEPTEVILYGYGSEYQYAAIDFFEHASNGRIYEDYDRTPPHPRYNTALSSSRSTMPRSLSQAAIRGINTYRGGEHWIKVTFDSAEAAERACHYSPHVIHGCTVYAELYRGVGPNSDSQIVASSNTLPSADGGARRRQPRPTQGSLPSRMQSTPAFPRSDLREESPAQSETTTASSATAITSGQDHSSKGTDKAAQQTGGHGAAMPAQQMKPLRIPTAKRAILLPASDALLPVPPWTARTFGHLPLIGGFLGGSSSNATVVDGAIPRTEQGQIDWAKASFWWRMCWWLDRVFGTDVLGVKGDD